MIEVLTDLGFEGLVFDDVMSPGLVSRMVPYVSGPHSVSLSISNDSMRSRRILLVLL